VGGAVVNGATERLVDWAAFLCEYSQLLPPLPAGPSPSVTGNNTVYRRELLQRHRAVLAQGWEDRLHQALRREGVTLFCRPEIQVVHKRHFTVGEYTQQRYLYSRSYAGARAAGASLVVRLAYGLAAIGLPPLLFARIVSSVWRTGRHRKELLRSLPLLGWFTVAWAAGEVVGALRGPGDALARVR